MFKDMPSDWDHVSKEIFEEAMDGFDYRRSGWSNAIEYIENQPNGRRLGYKTNDDNYYLHPGIIGGRCEAWPW